MEKEGEKNNKELARYLSASSTHLNIKEEAQKDLLLTRKRGKQLFPLDNQ